MFDKWSSLKKNSSRKTETQKQKEKEFTDTFEDLFDIAHVNALNMMTVQEDKDFLIAQREKGRRGAMSSLDKVFLKRQKRREKTLKKAMKRKLAADSAEEEAKKCQAIVVLDSSSTSSSEESNPVPGPSALQTPPTVKKRGRKEVLTPELSAALDRTKSSDRMAMHIVTQTARSLGHDVSELILNRSSIRRKRQHHRSSRAAEILSNFKPESVLIVHWDGKLMPDLTGHGGHVDRLPVLVSGNGTSQLLAVPKLPSGTGDEQAKAVVKALQQWHIADIVHGMCFDTTSSNTGHHKGACVKIEQLLGRDLLYFACRHHVLELVAGAAFEAVMGHSAAPDIQLFRRFQAKWEQIDKQKFEDSSTDDLAEESVRAVRDDLTNFIEKALLETQLRDDYRELLELASIFLGTSPSRGVRFSAPGAMHQARWMAKTIYSFKVWLFRSQFKLTPKENRGLRDLCIFFARIYVKAWTTAPLAAKAPKGDLMLLKALQDYSTISDAISKATFHKMMRHLWYLSEELVALAFFDDDVLPAVKDRMLEAMNIVIGEEKHVKRVTINPDTLQVKNLYDFTTKNTKSFFKKLNLNTDFLALPVEQWKDDPGFQNAKASVQALSVINDHAERGEALVQDFSGRITKDELQLQYLLQAVVDHRKSFPNALKQTLLGDKE